ncbi:site-specific DNA-methyltransferase [Neoaquamicrobium sediminum]|uniref:site-specific DNA-methyltransferase n=1 Tax=Neoaquamicrobium sediminum TaxID=1849104 RepID=UPI003BA91158
MHSINRAATRIEGRLLRQLSEFPGNPRVHSKRQLGKLACNISELGFLGVIVIDKQNRILAGHARWQAAQMAGLEIVDCLVVEHLSEAQKRAFVLADNRIALDAVWDIGKVNDMIADIQMGDLDIDLSLTGFDAPELDRFRMELEPQSKAPSPRDEALPELDDGPTVARPGDVVICGRHIVTCGDCRDLASFERLMGNERAGMVISDAPYNVKIQGHVGGSGRIRHREFEMATGEMAPATYTDFLAAEMALSVAFSIDGSLHLRFIDWRHLDEMLLAGARYYAKPINLVVWDKGVGGMGSMWRSQHELILVFKKGEAPHVNNVELGKHGRYRTNVWTYRGLNTGGAQRLEELMRHPTAKPVQMLADAMLDCSRPGDIVLDPFGGSGSTLIAAEKVGRRARLIELDPVYVDRIVRRYQDFAREDAVFADTGETFDQRRKRLIDDAALAASV